MKNILILDNRRARLAKLQTFANIMSDFSFDIKCTINKEQYIHGNYDIAIVHYNNPEASAIEDAVWISEKTKRVMFSGGFSKDFAEYDDIIFISEKYLTKSLSDLINRILK